MRQLEIIRIRQQVSELARHGSGKLVKMVSKHWEDFTYIKNKWLQKSNVDHTRSASRGLLRRKVHEYSRVYLRLSQSFSHIWVMRWRWQGELIIISHFSVNDALIPVQMWECLSALEVRHKGPRQEGDTQEADPCAEETGSSLEFQWIPLHQRHKKDSLI